MTGAGAAHPRVRDALTAAGAEVEVRAFPASTRTAVEAAAAIGCEVAAIAKSLVFCAGEDVVLVIASGADRVDEKRLATVLGERVKRPDADFVVQRTGFVIGGVAPIGLACEARVFIDRRVLEQGTVWASAGTAHSVFRIDGERLAALAGATIADVAV